MVKSKFAGLLRGLLRRMDADEAPPVLAARPIAAAAPAPRPVTPPVAPVSPVIASTPPAENEIALPLAPVVAGLAPELRAKIALVPPPGLTINVPVETILSQLPFGAVKISFGELRQMAASIFINSGGEHDVKMVNLPLNEVLPRLNPALLARRAAPKVEVGEEIKGPFGGQNAGVTFTTQPLKPAIPAPAVPRVDRPAVSKESPLPSAPIAFKLPPGMERPAPVANPVPSVPPPRPVAPIPAPHAPAKPVSTPAPVIPVAPVVPKISAAPAPMPTPVAARPLPAQPTIFASLWDLAENWPEELRHEISSSNLANESVPLAGDAVAASLKRGRMTLTWKQLRTLAKPSSPPSANDELELEVPMKVIAPLFFAAQKNPTSGRKTVKVSDEIPNLFFGFPQSAPEAPAAATKLVDAKPVDSNFYVWGDAGEAPKLEAPASQTDFTSRQAQPKEVVARAAALPGVVGVLVTLPDGLLVASQVPAAFNADTLAAFIPQIFERMNQSAKELRMGALNNVSFTVGNVPWRIYRVNSVFVAAFGRAGEALPAAELAKLAGELDRKKNQ
jgi:predicted regulator of Ras-like GTPase activity (Roadblock/LC7/MglB family)